MTQLGDELCEVIAEMESNTTTGVDPGRGADYESLPGQHGRDVYFRSRRYTSEDLNGVPHFVVVRESEADERCDLHDVSQTGVAFYWSDDVVPVVGHTFTSLQVVIDGHIAFEGQARVITVRQRRDQDLVAVAFVDSLMNMEDVLQARAVRTWAASGEHQLWQDARKLSRAGNHHFKASVAEMRVFFEEASKDLGGLEASLPWTVLHGESTGPARSSLVALMTEEFVPMFVKLSERLDEEIRRSSPAEYAVLKEYSQRMLQSYMMQAPFLHRTRFKPRGYPGDYVVMRYIYDQQFEGQNLFAKALHLAAVQTRGAQAVRERKNLIKSRLQSLIDSFPFPERTLRIASVAAGPAQEVYELLRDGTPNGQYVEFVLFDQDEEALAYGQSRIQPLIESRWKPWTRVVYLQDSIRRLIHDPSLFADLGPFDVIFCTGLFDYLRGPTAASLTRTFWNTLTAGGSAYIGNMHPSNPCRWFLEQHLEWFLTYRSHDEMLAFATEGAPDADISIVTEPTGVNPFLLVKKVT